MVLITVMSVLLLIIHVEWWWVIQSLFIVRYRASICIKHCYGYATHAYDIRKLIICTHIYVCSICPTITVTNKHVCSKSYICDQELMSCQWIWRSMKLSFITIQIMYVITLKFDRHNLLALCNQDVINYSLAMCEYEGSCPLLWVNYLKDLESP